jgi:thiamine-phosphate diphosphorylase/hydroxyethylthiazole kinase
LFQSSSSDKALDGVAVVSAIVAAKDPEKASQELLRFAKNPPPFAAASLLNKEKKEDVEALLSQVPGIIKAVGEMAPLSHNMTNLVVQNFSANVALSVGGSPIMASFGEEAADLCKLGGALVINMGTVTPDGILNYSQALRAYNLEGGPGMSLKLLIVSQDVWCLSIFTEKANLKSSS